MINSDLPASTCSAVSAARRNTPLNSCPLVLYSHHNRMRHLYSPASCAGGGARAPRRGPGAAPVAHRRAPSPRLI